jgi:hypothetical protein
VNGCNCKRKIQQASATRRDDIGCVRQVHNEVRSALCVVIGEIGRLRLDRLQNSIHLWPRRAIFHRGVEGLPG